MRFQVSCMGFDNNHTAEIPVQSSVAIIKPVELRSSELVAVMAIWTSHAGSAGTPTRDAVLPRPLAPYLRQISLARWLHQERDFEFRFAGDAHVQAYGFTSGQGNRMQAIESAEPGIGAFIRSAHNRTRERRVPLAYRGIIGRDFPNARFTWFETLYLPLRGKSDDIEYVLNASVYAPRGGAWSET